MSYQDDLRRQIETMSGGQMTLRFTAKGQPSYFYRLKKFAVETLDPALGTGTHPAFIVNGVEKDEILIGVHQAAEVDGEMVSQAARMPRVNINHDEAVALARGTGAGFCVATNAMYAALALKARADFAFPRGNNDSGRAHDAPDEYGVDAQGNSTEGGGAEAVRTGSGPMTWNYPRSPWGVQMLNGNVWEWSPGMRVVDGEIQVIADNDAVLAGTDLSTNGPWQAIDAATGNLVAPGTAGTVIYATSGTTDGTIVGGGSGQPFADLTPYGLSAAAEQRLTQLALTSPGAPIEGDGWWINESGERVPRRGGRRGAGSRAGVFALYLVRGRGISNSNIGFRPAFVI
jgi:hypothetical protein